MAAGQGRSHLLQHCFIISALKTVIQPAPQGFIPMKLPFVAPYSLTVAGAEGSHTLSPHPVLILNCRKRAEMVPLIKLTFGETAADGSGWKDCVAVLGFLKNSGQSDQFSQSLERLNEKESQSRWRGGATELQPSVCFWASVELLAARAACLTTEIGLTTPIL